MDMFFSWKRVWEYFPKVAAKFPVTINIVLVSFALALLLGVLIALIRIKRVPVLEQLTVIYISFIRGTPILVQLFIVYYGMPVLLNNVFHIDISHWNKMIYVYVAYGLNQSAFLAEIIRAAVHSVDIIQTEAGYSIGLTERQTFTRIVVPQAFVVAVPQLETAFVTLFRATALAYMLGIIDVVGKAKSIGVNTHHTIEGYVCAAIIFTFTSIILEQIFKKGQLQYDRR